MWFDLQGWSHSSANQFQGAVRRELPKSIYHVYFDNRWFSLEGTEIGEVIHLYNTKVGKIPELREYCFVDGLESIMILSQTLETSQPAFKVNGCVSSIQEILDDPRIFPKTITKTSVSCDKPTYKHLELFGIF